MWTERYQPTTIDECVIEHLSPENETFLKSIVQRKLVPNLLFYGPPGTGKSTLARIIATRDLYCLFPFNGNDFSDKKVLDKLKRHQREGGTICSPNRLILIDEVDLLTLSTQEFIRAMMDDQRVPISWVFTSNYRKDLSDPLLSRLMQIEVGIPVTAQRDRHRSGLLRRCRQVLDQEGISGVSDQDVMKVIDVAYPDFRQILTLLQMTFGYSKAA